MSVFSEPRPKLTAFVALQWIILFAAASYTSVLIGNIDGSLLLYLPAGFGIICIHWYGPRVLPILFLNGLFTVYLWEASGSIPWLIFLASHEPVIAFASWMLARQLIDPQVGFKDSMAFSKFILLGIVLPNLINCFYTYQYSFVDGDLEQVVLLWLADFITMYCLAVPALHFFRPGSGDAFRMAKSTVSLDLVKQNLPEAVLLITFFLGLNFLIDFKQYWFVYSICTIIVALRWGFGMAVFSNFLVYAVSYLMPVFLEAGDVRLFQSSQLVSVHVGMATMFFVSALIGRALSDNRNTEVELQEQKKSLIGANEQLKKTNLDLDRFVYSVSHDISAPLKSIKGLVSLFRMDESANSPSAKDYLEKIDISIHKLEAFIDEVLDHSRASRKEINLEVIYLYAFLEEVLDNLKYVDNFGRIKFHYELQVPTLESDRFLLKVILSNLLSNAVKYQKTDPAHNPEIHVTSRQERDKIFIAVEDNGEGIPPDNQKRIFEMFYRSSMQAKGSGLGLFIAREAAQRMRGDIRFQSKFGSGSIFTLVLPV